MVYWVSVVEAGEFWHNFHFYNLIMHSSPTTRITLLDYGKKAVYLNTTAARLYLVRKNITVSSELLDAFANSKQQASKLSSQLQV